MISSENGLLLLTNRYLRLKCYDFVMGNDYNEMVYECEMIYACERVGLHDGLL